MKFKVWTNNGTITFEELEKNINNKLWIAKNCAMTVDGIAMFYMESVSGRYIFAINIYAMSNKIIFSIDRDTDVRNSMSKYSYLKFKEAYNLNINTLIRVKEGIFE